MSKQKRRVCYGVSVGNALSAPPPLLPTTRTPDDDSTDKDPPAGKSRSWFPSFWWLIGRQSSDVKHNERAASGGDLTGVGGSGRRADRRASDGSGSTRKGKETAGSGGEGWWSRYESESISLADLALTLVSTCHPEHLPVNLARVNTIKKTRTLVSMRAMRCDALRWGFGAGGECTLSPKLEEAALIIAHSTHKTSLSIICRRGGEGADARQTVHVPFGESARVFCDIFVCFGKHFARTTFWIACMCFLAGIFCDFCFLLTRSREEQHGDSNSTVRFAV